MDPLWRIPALVARWQFDRPLSHAEIHEAFGTPLQPDVSARDGRADIKPGSPATTADRVAESVQFPEERS